MTTTNTTTNWTHPWTRAGLGLAPFRFAGYYEDRGPRRWVEGGVEVVVGAPGQPMGVCSYCGQGIAHVYAVQSADGRRSTVGQDCIARLRATEESDRRLRAEALLARRDAQRAARRRRSEAQRAEALARHRAQEAAEQAHLRAEAEARWPDLAAVLATDRGIVREIAERYAATARISPAQVDLCRRLHAEATTAWGPVPEGRARHRGVVVRSWVAQSEWGATHLVDVRVEGADGPWILRLRGGRWLTWDAAAGDRIEVLATVEQRSAKPHIGTGLRAAQARRICEEGLDTDGES
jgi:hypothetical protein